MKNKVLEENCLRALKTLQEASIRENPHNVPEITDHNMKIAACLAVLGMALMLGEKTE